MALNDRHKLGGRAHIPYRNSLMTTILRDSLGGNCQTVMIATLSLHLDNIEETVSTLRFSQRVGMLENEVEKNQKVVKVGSMEQLARENELLRTALARHRELLEGLGPLPSEERALERVTDWLGEVGPELEVRSAEEGRLYLAMAKRVYSDKMREFVTELTKIQEQLQKYDEEVKRQGWYNKETMSERGGFKTNYLR